MSTKAKIQKVRFEVEAHENRGWLKGYEEGLAVREKDVVDLQLALEQRNKRILELNDRLRSKNKKAPKTPHEAISLAWNLAHKVKKGQTIPAETAYLLSLDPGVKTLWISDDDIVVSEEEENLIRTLEPLREIKETLVKESDIMDTCCHCNTIREMRCSVE